MPSIPEMLVACLPPCLPRIVARIGNALDLVQAALNGDGQLALNRAAILRRSLSSALSRCSAGRQMNAVGSPISAVPGGPRPDPVQGWGTWLSMWGTCLSSTCLSTYSRAGGTLVSLRGLLNVAG